MNRHCWHRARLATAAWLTLALLVSMAVHAEEHIVSFHSDIRVNADASMDVTETIRVRAEGREIRRGIYREIPTRYRDRFGNAFRVDLEVSAVTRDGQPEPWSARQRSNGIRVDFGDDSFLAVPAEYEYAIHYRTSRQVGYFEDHDELYWNVTGNGWNFRITEASATVRLPGAVAAQELAMEGYTGRAGTTGQAYEVTLSGGQGAIRTTAALPPTAGLTLVLSWPKGIVREPDRATRVGYVLKDNRGLLLALATLVAVAAYLGYSWTRVGRDPAPGVIFPHYDPPAGFSPAAARYVMKMGFDGKVLTSAIVNLAVKGYLQITQTGSKFSLVSSASTRELAPEEQVLLDKLFASGPVLELENSNHAIFGKAQSALAGRLKQGLHKVYFATNSRVLLPSLLGTLVMGVLIAAIGAFVPLVAVIGIAIVLLHCVFAWLMKAPTARGRELMDKLEGFRLYLEVAEKDELNQRHPPDITPELFERYLPFAIALGVEQGWAQQFTDRLATIGEPRGSAWHPLWYHGPFNPGRMGDFTKTVSNSFTTAISSAGTPPGTSSGAGGGGFSGGGGGGGGGGGR